MDPAYDYEAINVEAQSSIDSSLLNWMRRLIMVKRRHKAFSRGRLTFLFPDNRQVLAYLRELNGEVILCVANLSRSPQETQLILAGFQGRMLADLLNGGIPHQISDLPYLLTLPPYGFFWYMLVDERSTPDRHEAPPNPPPEFAASEPESDEDRPEPLPEFVPLILGNSLSSLLETRNRNELESGMLSSFLANQRWFATKDAAISSLEIVRAAELPGPPDVVLLATVEATLDGGAVQSYLLPMAVAWGEDNLATTSPLRPFTIAKARRANRVGAIYDASASDGLALALLDGLQRELRLTTETGEVRFVRSPALDEVELSEHPEVHRLSVEQSNTSMIMDRSLIWKLYRRPLLGPHPEVEIGHFLADVAGYANTPPLLGSVELSDAAGTTTLAASMGFVLNQGDGWAWTLDYLERELETLLLDVDGDGETEPDEPFGIYGQLAQTMGQRTAELHHAFATPTEDPAFAAEPIEVADLKRWAKGIEADIDRAARALERGHEGVSEADRSDVDSLLEALPSLVDRLTALTGSPIAAMKTRLHGDYHLGQVLIAKSDIYIFDFEGEPAREMAERRAKVSPLKDVAEMLRSFDYAASAAIHQFEQHDPAKREAAAPLAEAWRQATQRHFLEGYRVAIVGCQTVPEVMADFDRLLELFLIQKGVYEILYEIANRPGWVGVPVRGALGLMDPEQRNGLFSDG